MGIDNNKVTCFKFYCIFTFKISTVLNWRKIVLSETIFAFTFYGTMVPKYLLCLRTNITIKVITIYVIV